MTIQDINQKLDAGMRVPVAGLTTVQHNYFVIQLMKGTIGIDTYNNICRVPTPVGRWSDRKGILNA